MTVFSYDTLLRCMRDYFFLLSKAIACSQIFNYIRSYILTSIFNYFTVSCIGSWFQFKVSNCHEEIEIYQPIQPVHTRVLQMCIKN